MSARLAAVVCAGAAMMACARPAPAGGSGGGELSFEWASTDTALGRGTWRGPAEAAWCEAERRLTVFAARNDTGAALLVMLPTLATADSLPLVPATDTATMPRAVAALRWPDARALVALASTGGTLRLTRVSPTLAGSFEGTLAAKGDDDTTTAPKVSGRLEGVPVATGEAGCRRAGVGPTP